MDFSVYLHSLATVLVIAAAADIDNISRSLDFNTLQENVSNITFCNIESELVSLNVILHVNHYIVSRPSPNNDGKEKREAGVCIPTIPRSVSQCF